MLTSPVVPGNWLVPRRNWEPPTKFNATMAAIWTYVDYDGGRILRGYHQAPGRRAGAGADNAVNPAFREMLSMLILGAKISTVEPTRDDVAKAAREMRDFMVPLFRSVAPVEEGGGA